VVSLHISSQTLHHRSDLFKTRMAGKRCLLGRKDEKAPLGRLEKLHRVACRVLEDNLLSAKPLVKHAIEIRD
jgi:hypothetical protein